MKLDVAPNGDVDSLDAVAHASAAAEQGGADGIVYPERSADAMLHVTVAAPATSRVELLTGVVVAFARSPMTLASQAWSVQQFSGGRFVLGLGSQVQAHIERRFSMPWGSPVGRMRDFVGALAAIWISWSTGEALAYEGEYYRHTLMSPMFTPSGAWPPPRVMLAALGPAMTELAAMTADGVLLHPFMTETYVRDQVQPALQRGATARNARSAGPFEVCGSPFLVTGPDEESLAAGRAELRSRLAFYGSTPAYRRVLELHGWEDLGDRLHELSTTSDKSKWAQMSKLIPEEMMNQFALIGDSKMVAKDLVSRYSGLFDRCQLNVVGRRSLADHITLLGEIRSAQDQAQATSTSIA